MKSIQSNIKKAKKYLDNNHCIAVPTETVYGLAANAYSSKHCQPTHIQFLLVLRCIPYYLNIFLLF